MIFNERKNNEKGNNNFHLFGGYVDKLCSYEDRNG